jgi:D-tyrosyl-tRNA(Tyr) deacylase
MKALIQRVTKGKVTIDGETAGEIGTGYVVFLGVRHADAEKDARYLAHRTLNLRVFPDSEDKMNLSVREVDGGILVISQFTLYADTKKGNRPSFVAAAEPGPAESLYNTYVEALRSELGTARVATGRFGAMMRVEIVNDGPVTIELTTDGKNL